MAASGGPGIDVGSWPPHPKVPLCPILDVQLLHSADSLASAPDDWLRRQVLLVFCSTVRDLADKLVAAHNALDWQRRCSVLD